MARLAAWFGGIGAVIGVLCCFTPLLPTVLTMVGTAGLIEVLYRDAILLPFAGVSMLVMVFGLFMMRRT